MDQHEYSVEKDLQAAFGGNWKPLDASGWAGYESEFSKPSGNKLLMLFNKFNVQHDVQATDTGYSITIKGSVQGALGLYYPYSSEGKPLQDIIFPDKTTGKNTGRY